MALRFIQIFLPHDRPAEIERLLEGHEVLGVWRDANIEDKSVIHLLLPADETEEVMDRFEEAFSDEEGFHMLLLPVEAALPRKPPPDPEETIPTDGDSEADDETDRKNNKTVSRISREELYEQLSGALSVDAVFIIMAALSGGLAAAGLMRDDLAVLIGAMVIAPLLAPNVALGLATTLCDNRLLRTALIANIIGASAVLIVSVLLGIFIRVDPATPAIVTRTTVDFGHIALALGAGLAGALAYTRGLPAAVIGVMVAVALVPPLSAFGLLLGQGAYKPAMGALALTGANVICVNLASTATFIAQGLRPADFVEAERAKRSTRKAIAIWLALLAALIAIIVVRRF